ncbi:MAG: sulfatase-like hydrolase/transferase [Thermomicrobiales bacterium]
MLERFTGRYLRVARLIIALFLLATSASHGLGLPSATVTASAPRPDIVLVLTDDMNSDDWRALPNSTKFLTAEFPNYINTDPLCCPSRASILSGLYPHNHGTWFIDPVRGGGGGWQSFRDREKATIATMLSKSGYRTGLIGKYLNNYEPKAGPRPGWDYWFAFGKPEYKQNEVADGRKVRHSHKYSTDLVSARAQAFILRSDAATPIFAYITPNAPHGPAVPPKRYASDYLGERLVAEDKPSFGVRIVDGPPYLGSSMSSARIAHLTRFERQRQCTLKAVDDLLVRVHAALVARGRPYYLFVASDNGYLLGEHGEVGKGVPYDESTRTTMRAVSGGGAPDLSGSTKLVANIDWMETFAEIGSAKPPYQSDGESLISGSDRDLVVIEHKENPPRSRRRSAEFEAVVGESTKTPSYRGLHVATGELYVEYATGFVEYYAGDDPYRLRNVASSSAERVAELAALLHRYQDCRGDACP